ncbi:hypothetical protein NO976_02319 [Planktothrix agardhii]|jgi:hypothetical protein|nr:hypothetical protein NIVACYA_02538 [Planktothrix agardhii]BBD56252.1 hypothetical protein NIES204_35770 [Planktothrix agardhii NIES-204]CAD5946372.1 hypothetical protein NO976_02319 [Planktothrix agardhii]CAD5957280.1 hypothetical protein PANO66_03030 [Planktothrix agardhii]CAD5959853.1 hypothetical protein PCC7805_03117 [Planktothrix agardhii]
MCPPSEHFLVLRMLGELQVVKGDRRYTDYSISKALPEGRQNQEANFPIFNQGKWGILELLSQPNIAKVEGRDRLFETQGICIIHYYDCNRCNQEPDEIVQEFIDILS